MCVWKTNEASKDNEQRKTIRTLSNSFLLFVFFSPLTTHFSSLSLSLPFSFPQPPLMMRCTRKLRQRLTSYLTDVEGDFTYFQRFVRMSQVVGHDDATRRFYLKGDETQFVFGGDCFDKGFDLSFSEALLQLKKDYPSRVHLLLGNRDVNKMVFLSSFNEKVLSLSPKEAHHHVYPYESPVQLRSVGYADFLAERNLPPKTTMPTLLQWMLSNRMGSPTAFENRRRELAHRAGIESPSGDTISDDEVVDSYIDSVHEGGVVREYLRHGQLAAIIGNTLFVHGAVGPESIGFVPDPFSAQQAISATTRLPGRDFVALNRTAHEWVDALNDFAHTGFEEWVAFPELVPGKARSGGEYLRSYAFRYTPTAYSVMVSTFVQDKQPRYVELPAVEYLALNGIATLCCGHQPAGDSPTIITQPGLRIMMADNSYCADDNTRGEAVSELLLDSDTGSIRVRGSRSNGAPFDFTIDDSADADGTAMTSLLGRHLGDGWWTKLPSSDNPASIICQRTLDGFMNIEYKTVPVGEVREQLAAEAMRQTPVGGEPFERWTRESLAYQHRLKTKRTPQNISPSSL